MKYPAMAQEAQRAASSVDTAIKSLELADLSAAELALVDLQLRAARLLREIALEKRKL